MSGDRAPFSGDTRILVVCTGNLCRSPFAEGYLRQVLGCEEVSSAGTHAVPGNRVPEDGLSVAQRFGVDLSGHRARRLSLEDVEEAELILCMEPYHLAMVEPMALPLGVSRERFVTLDIPDPYGRGQAAYEDSYAQIAEFLKRGAQD